MVPQLAPYIGFLAYRPNVQKTKGFSKGRVRTVTTASALPGFMLLNGSLQAIAFNSEAVQILAYPTRPDRIQHVTVFLNDKIRSSLLKHHNGCEVAFVKEYRSGGRQYICRAFHVHCPVQEDALCSTALLLERHCTSETDMRDLLLQFDLTPREQETVTLLIEGLTSKEIANRMNISPNTVKAFLRLVMVKMDVSTRSGIVGKIVGPHS
jgi:DNA-binding CsgD family transcriptional regulator